MQDLLDWKSLHSWAEQKEANSVVGESCTNGSCPLAQYLHEQTDRYWSVGPSIRSGEVRLKKPAWVKALIEKTDQVNYNTRNPVTREQFLSVLEQVREE
jgi:hypothetical protein